MEESIPCQFEGVNTCAVALLIFPKKVLFGIDLSVDIYIARGEEQFGPYPLEQVQELLDQGALLPEDLAFHEGLDNWTPLAEVIATQDVPPIPPLPPTLPPAAEEISAPDTPVPAPTAEPQPASIVATQSKPKKQVPLWVTIVVLLVVLGGLAGGAVWYVFFKPNPEEDDGPLLEDPTSMSTSKKSENQNSGPSGGIAGPVIPSPTPTPIPTPAPTPPSPSDPLAKNILGKRLVCKTSKDVELILQFGKDGTFSIGTVWQGQFSQQREAVHYNIDGLKVKLSDNGRENGDVTFSTDNPKEGDQISFGPEQSQITATILRIEPAKAFEISTNPSTGGNTATPEPSDPEPVTETKKLTAAQVEEILAQEIGSWKVKGNITTLDPKTGTGEAKEFEDKLETRWKEKGESTISSFGAGMGQNLTGTTEYDTGMEWFVWRVQGEGRPETVSKNIYDPATKTYHQLLMLPDDHVERGTFKRINKDEAILKSEIFNADNELVATQEINFTRIKPEATEPTEPGDKKLTPVEVEKILAAQIGQWQVKGQVKQAEGDPIPYEFRMDIQWKEKGESISGKGSLEKNGQRVSLFSHKEYDPVKGVFLFRFRDELRPEILSHEQYDPATQTFRGQQVSPREPEVTYSFQADGPNKFIFKMKTTRNGQLISTDESVQTRIATTVTEPTKPEPTSGGDDKSVKIIEAAIRKSLNKPEGEITKVDLEKVTELNFALAGTKITDAVLKEVAKCKQLKLLNFNEGQITAEGLKEVAKLQKLETLGLSSTGVTDAGLKEVAKCTQLTFLNLMNTKITDAGLKEVVKLKKLNDLTLAGTKITGAGLKELAKMNQLRTLWLDETKITKVDVTELKKALPKCNIWGP